jgi:hypothetical protein
MTRVFVFTILAVVLLTQSAVIHAANIDAALPNESQNTGIVTGLQGLVMVHRPSVPDGQIVRAGQRVHAANEIHLQADGRVEVLWDRRAVFSLHGDSWIRLLDPIGRQTRVQLSGGKARLAYSYNEGHSTDTLAILISDALLIMRGGILEVESETWGQVIRVVEGQVSIEMASSPGKQVLLKVGQAMEITAGTLNPPHPSKSAMPPSLAAMEQHRAVPVSVVQHLARIHVQQALELEEHLRHAAENDNSHADENGLILSTSLGLPSFPITSGTAATSPLPSITPSSLGSPGIPIPAGALPPPTVPNIVTLSPVQAGGINTATVLQNTLKPVLGGR